MPKTIGGQPGNKNAERWDEENALKLGEELMEWLTDEGSYYENVYFQRFLMINKSLGHNTINYLCNKFDSFRDYIREAKRIQEVKISEGALNQKFAASPAIFQLKAKFGYHEGIKKTDYDFEKEEEQGNTHLLTKSTRITNVYLRNIEAVEIGKRIISNKGSSRSSKTRSLIDIHLDFLLTGFVGTRRIDGNAGVFQKSLPFLKKNLLEDILKVIEERGMVINEDINWNKTECYFEIDGRKWFYGSLNNESEIAKVKGLGLGLIWFNEAHDILYAAFKQLNMRARKNAIFFLDHNPENENSWVKTEIEEKRFEAIGDVEVIHSTYKDNRFLPESTVQEIENFKLTDPDWFNIYGLGQYGSLKGQIYTYEEYTELPRAKFTTFSGQDFGFTNSKDALIDVYYRMNHKEGIAELYLKPRLYRNGILPNELTSLVNEIMDDDRYLYADSEDARMIGDERNAGINVFRAKKSVQRAIKLGKCFKLFVHKDDIELQKEFKMYRYQKDPNNDQRFLNIPVKGHNVHEHLINALQYALLGAVDMKIIPLPKNFKDKK